MSLILKKSRYGSQLARMTINGKPFNSIGPNNKEAMAAVFVLARFGERAARKAWAEAEKLKNERILSALHFINAGDFAHAKSILEGAVK